MNCWARKEEYLLIAHKLAIADENSLDALDRSPNRDDRTENSVCQASAEKLERDFFHLGDRYPTRYTDNGHSHGSGIGWLGRRARSGPKYGFNECGRSEPNFRRQRLNPRLIGSGKALKDAGARGDSRPHSDLSFSCSMVYPIGLSNSQRTVKPQGKILFRKRFFRRLSVSTTLIKLWKGGRS